VAEKYTSLLREVAASPDPVITEQSERELAVQVLARVIVLSQFSRHILPRGKLDNPGTSEEYDVAARRLSTWLIERGAHMQLRHYEKRFLYLPFTQSEDLADQERSVQLFAELHEQAIADGRRAPGSRAPGAAWVKCRRDVVAKFGRLPFRNVQLGRESTPAELAYLSRWGRGAA